MLLWQVAAFPRKLLQIVRRGWRNASSATVAGADPAIEGCPFSRCDESTLAIVARFNCFASSHSEDCHDQCFRHPESRL